MITTSLDPQKIANLQTRRANGESICLWEFVAVYWPQPDGTIFYSCLPWDQASNLPPNLVNQLQALPNNVNHSTLIETRFLAGKGSTGGSWFRDVTISSGIADTVVNLDFLDTPDATTGVRTISSMFLQYGEGVKCEIFYYYPQEDLLQSIWWGHLQAPDNGDCDGRIFKASAASGFRSILLNLPSRAFVPYCTAQYGPAIRAALGNSLPIISACPMDADIGGGHGIPGFPTCSKLLAACQQRFGVIQNIPWLGFDVVAQPSGGSVWHGGTLATTTGNTTNLHDPLRVIFGERTVQALFLLQFTVDANVDHPERGSLTAFFAVCEGPIQSIDRIQLDGIFAPISTNTQIRLGTIQQDPTRGFSVPHIIDNAACSSTAVIDVIIKGDYRTATYSNITGACHVFGLNDVKAYNADGTVASSNMSNGQNPAWALLRCITDKTWGMGEDLDRVYLPDFIALASYCNDLVTFTDSAGTVVGPSTRFTFNADLAGRSAADQIKDICKFRWFTPPFPFEGKTRIMPLKTEVLTSDIPYFKDFDSDRNIIWENNRTTLTWRQMSSRNLPNQLTINFDDADNFNVQRPILINDETAQIAAGKAFGDYSIRVITKLESALGATHLGEVVRSGNYLLDRGEFDTGGLVNPFSIKFKTHIVDCIGLHKYSIIKVHSTNLTEIKERYGHEYWRVMDLKFKGGLAEVTAQVYPKDYMEKAEAGTSTTRPVVITTGGGPGGGGPGGGSPTLPIKPPRIIQPTGPDDPPDIIRIQFLPF